jgi:putative DNA primase/helicase
VWGVDGELRFHRIRPDDPRPDMTKLDKVVKYEQPTGTPPALDVPRCCQPYLKDTERPLWIVEGEKKADALASRGEVAIAVLGVWMWKKDDFLLPDWNEVWTIGREINIAFDSDVHRKHEVMLARAELSKVMGWRSGYAS